MRNKIWFLLGMCLVSFTLSCSTGPDYKRDSEYDIGSNSYRPGAPADFSAVVTEDGFFQLDWEHVMNHDGYLLEKHVDKNDTISFEELAILEADETRFTDSAGIENQIYSYHLTPFIYDGKNKKGGRDTLSLSAEVSVAEIESMIYQQAGSGKTDYDRVVISTNTKTHQTSRNSNTSGINLLSGIILEYKTPEMDSYHLIDTLYADITEENAEFFYEDTVRAIMKKFRAKPFLNLENFKAEGSYAPELSRTVNNPFRIFLKQLDEITFEYTVSVGHNLNSDAQKYEGVIVYLNDAPVDTLSGTFPQIHTLSAEGYDGMVEVSLAAYLKDFESNRISAQRVTVNLLPPFITNISGESKTSHTIEWDLETNGYPFPHSFIIERRVNENQPFEHVSVVDGERRSLKIGNITADEYEYRIRTITSEPGAVKKTRFMELYDFIKTEDNLSGTFSRDFTHRLVNHSGNAYSVYQNQNKVADFDLEQSGFTQNLSDYRLIMSTFSDDNRAVVFLFRQRNGVQPAVFVYDIEERKFTYVKSNVKHDSLLDLWGARIAYSRTMGKIVYLNKLVSGNSLGVIDLETGENTLTDFPTGFYDNPNGLIALEDKFVMYNGFRKVVEIDSNLTITEKDQRLLKIVEADLEMYEYEEERLTMFDLRDFSKTETPVTKRIMSFLYYDSVNNKLFYRDRVSLGGLLGVFAYDPETDESIKIHDVVLDYSTPYKRTDKGFEVIKSNAKYLVEPSDVKQWTIVQEPDTY